MNTYPYDTILVNGRAVQLQGILSQAEMSHNDFETGIFSFIHDWFSGKTDFIQHTSGSTGTPKAIVIRREQMIESARLSERALRLRRSDVALCCLSAGNIAGKMMLVRSFTTGMRVICVAPTSNPFRGLLADQRVDFAALVPAQVHDIVRSEASISLGRVRKVIIGGGALDAQSLEMLQDMDGDFFATYGMTETISHIALKLLNGPGASSHYTTLPGITVTMDVRNCLVIHWSNLPHEMVTNDLVELIDSTNFRWLGRWDNVINTGGIKVIPEVLEGKLATIFQALNLGQNFFTAGLADDKLGNKIALFVEGPLSAGGVESLTRAMHQTLLRHEVPGITITGKSFVYTENGKINRAATMNAAELPRGNGNFAD